MSEIPSGTFSLYVTHIEAEGPLLKIWGQTNKEEASKIETIIQDLSVHFKNGIGSVTSDCLLIPNTICCAYHDDGYYRARICRIQSATNTVLVQFIDYGNVESVPFNQIRQHNDTTEGIMLQTLPPVANDFNLTDVLPFDLRWSPPIIEYIKNTLRYHEWPASVVSLDGKKRWLNLYFNGRRFCDFLKESKMALPAQRSEMLEIIDTVPANYHHHQLPNNNIHLSKQRNQQQQNNNWRQAGQVSPSSKIQQSSSPPQTSTPKSKSPEARSQLVFTSRLIDKTSQVLVTVSHIDDGPLKFSIQLKDTQDELADLMKKINNYHVKKLSEPPITPGTVCLGKHSKDNVLRRAVMMAVTEQLDAKVFYIDYGDNEILKETDMYELPAEFINPPPFSLHFTLSDVRNLHVSQEMKRYFSQIVKNKTLMLHVRPLGTSTLIQYGCLFDNNGKSILEMLMEKYPDSVNTWPSVKLLTPSTREEVHVSYVESCSKFFVQLDKCTTNGQLDTVIKDVAESIKTAAHVKQEDVKVGSKFLAQCVTDSQWYRAEVINIQNNTNLITVHYSDYGNDEALPINSLRSLIFGSKSTKIPALAIPCILSGYESAPINEEVDFKFEELVLDKPLIIDVAEVRPNGSIIVNLYDTSTKPIVNISPMLRIATSTPSTNANSTNSIVPVTSMPAAPVVSSSPVGTPISSGRAAPIQRSGVKTQPTLDPHQKSKTKNVKKLRPGNDLNKSFDNSPTDMPKKSWKDEQNEQQKRPMNNQKQWQNGDQGRQNQGQRDGGRNRRDSWNQPEKNFSDRDSDTFSRSGGDGRRSQYDRDNNFNQRDQRREPRRDSRKDYGDNQKNQNNSSWDRNSRSPQSSREFKHPAPPREYTNPLSRDVDNPPSRDFNNPPPRDFNNRPTNNTFALVKITKDFKIPPPNITLGAVKNCLVVYAANPSDFYVQLCPDNLELDNIMEKIAKIYETGGNKLPESSIKVDASCVARYSVDETWYRGIIQSLDNSTSGATVQFIDYGNMEVVKYNNIKEIQEDISKLSTQAIHCKLLGPEENIQWNNDQIDKFSYLTDEEGLEAEFVGCDDKNGTYEILLRRVVNGVPANDYINNYYAPKVDLMRVKDALKNKNRKDPINQPSPATNIRQIDYASPGDTWENRHVDFGKTEAVFVSWYDNPESFFVQALTENEFRPMMNELQIAYVNEKPINDAYLKPGTAVIAVYSSEGALYRADIVKSNGSNGFIVKYVDFGNEESVQKNQVFKVNKKFMKLPKQAVKCCLNILPMSNDKSWSQSAVEQIEKILIDVEQLDCTFDKADSNDKYVVSLSNKGVNIEEEIVNKRLAIYPVPVMPAKPDIIESLPSTLRQENVDISLLVGQTLRVNVSSVESAGRFFIQLPSASASNQIIGDFMANKNPQVMKKLSVREVAHLGAGCLVKTDQGWQRAVVIKCSQKSGSNVRLIDTGENRKMPVDCMLALPNQLAVMQNQAIECFIKNAQSSSPVNQKLKGLIENKEIIINVEEIQNNRLAVKLYNNLGHKIKITDNEVDEVISILCPMPVLSITHNVTASHIDNSKSIWLKKCNESDIDAELLQELYDYYSQSGTPLYPEIGKLCAGRSVDENWYRAKVLEINDDGAVVHFVDYGNTEQIHPDYLRELEPRFCVIPQLAIQVGLSVSVRGTDIEQKTILSPYLLDKEFTASLYSIHKNWIMEMEAVPGKKISEILKSLNVIVVDEPVVVKPVVDPNEPKDMIIGGKYVIKVKSVESPAGFWIQRLKDEPCIDILQNDLQNLSKGFKTIEGVPEENLICAAVYSGDDMWYRAEVIDADADIVTVRFIDYGNTDTVSYPYNDKIKHLPAAFKVVPRHAIKCRLDLSPIDEYDWSGAVSLRFDTLATSYDCLQAIVLAEDNPLRVQLLYGTNDLADILIKENLAVKMQNHDEIIERELDPNAAFVSHINSPNEFWIQQGKSVPELELIADRFVVADMFSHLDNIYEGQLCVAKFPEDGLWYRAKVLSRNDTGIKVNYIDYGNTAVSTEIREIPIDVSTIAPLSRKCYLPLPAGYDKWSNEACREFTKMAGDGATIFHLEIINENCEISKVKLTLDGKDITDDLIKYCQPAVSISVNTITSLDNILSNVLVSNVTSPGEFWIQAENKISEVELMGSKLENALNFMPLNTFAEGTICAATFPEDNLWYRAKIIYHSGNDTKVLYIDYGNSAVTNELRALPENIINIPALSRQCALKLPDNINCWSKEACEKFIELVADGETVFQYEQLDQNERNYVRLSLNGNDILNVLVPLCINTLLTSNKETVYVESDKSYYQQSSYSDDTGVGGSVPSETSTADIPFSYSRSSRPASGSEDTFDSLNRTFPSNDSFNASTSSTSPYNRPDHLRSEIVEHCSNSYNISDTFEISTPKAVETDISIVNETMEQPQIVSTGEELVLSPISENGNSIIDETSGVYQSCTEDDASFVDESENHPEEVNQETVESPSVPSTEEDENVVETINQEQGILIAEDEIIIEEDIAEEIIVSEDPNVKIVVSQRIAEKSTDEYADVKSDDDSSPTPSAKISVDAEEMN